MLTIEKHLPKAYKAQLNLRKAVIGSVHKQNAHKAMQVLKQLPTELQQRPHLKRVNKNEQEPDLVALLLCFETEKEEKVVILQRLGEFLVKTNVKDVPADPPNTKEDYNQWNQYWPINFIEQQIFKTVKHTKEEQLFLRKSIQKGGELVIFDKDQELFIMPIDEGCREGTINHPVMKMLELWPQSKAFTDLPQAYYLTKLRLFCSSQLCGMCSMALVHSRLERIYFPYPKVPQPCSDILCCPQLNHKVLMFTVLEK